MSYYDTYNNIGALVGKTIKKIYMSADELVFDTDGGLIGFTVDGDCCSTSYFYDFHGVKKLLAGNPVKSVAAIDLDTPNDADSAAGDVVEAYGFEIVTEDPKFGDVTSVFSFRNDSNGYYGGSLYQMSKVSNKLPEQELTDDFLGEVHSY